MKLFYINANNGAGTVFTLGKPICGSDIVSNNYISIVIIQNHKTNGYVLKIFTCDIKSTGNEDIYDVYNFKMMNGSASIWYI